MEDAAIVQLFWDRSEEAIEETRNKYGGICRSIAMGVLHSREDAEECVSDALLALWNAIPPQRPRFLGAFLGRIVRNAALDCYDYNSALRRDSGFPALLEELAECVGGEDEEMNLHLLGQAISAYLAALPAPQRQVFLRRYWYCASIGKIAEEFHFSASKVKSMLHRTRLGLRDHLIKEGYDL